MLHEPGTIWGSTLKRKTPLRAKKPMTRNRQPMKRGAPLRRISAKKAAEPGRSPRSTLRPKSEKQIQREKDYKKAVKAWRKRCPWNEVCGVCLSRSLRRPWPGIKRDLLDGKEAELVAEGARFVTGTETHHYRGRNAALMSDPRFFIRTCRGCREFPHENRREAEALVLIAPRSIFDVPAGPGEEGFPGS